MTKQSENLLLGKLPPQAVELEGAILGAIMLTSGTFEMVFDVIKSGETFYNLQNGVIYECIKRLFVQGTSIDFMTVIDDLRKTKELEEAGGSYYVTSLTKDVVSNANVLEHAKIVRQKAMLRDAIKICGETITKCYEGEDVFEIIDKTQSDLGMITVDLERSRIETIGEAMTIAMDESIRNKENGVELIGYSTGFKSLDDKIGGIIKSDYIIIAAGTAEGKSTLAMNMAKHLSFEQNIPTAFFSLEMQNKQLAYKIISNCIEVSVKSLRIGKIDDLKVNEAMQVKAVKNNAPLYLNDKGGINIADMCSIIRQLKRKKGVEVVFVDYLQLVSPDSPNRKSGNREQDVSFISKQLRSLALELDIAIIALSQLAELEKGAQRPYKMGDLRESKAIGHDATTVLFIWKPILPSQNREIKDVYVDNIQFEPTKKDALIICAKNRLDETGVLRFVDEFQSSRFKEYQTDYPTIPQLDNAQINPPTTRTIPPITPMNEITDDLPF